MTRFLAAFGALAAGDFTADRVVPKSGQTSTLTVITAGAMAFLAVFVLALSLASGHLATRWEDALARTSTVRISAPPDQIAAQTRRVLDVLQTTPGVASARALDSAETKALLSPWFGPELPIDALPLPQLIDVTEDSSGYDAEGLRLRLSAEAPGATLDDHMRWRRPLVEAAGRLRLLGLVSLGLITVAMAGMVSLAAQAALSANGQVIKTLRLLGARDTYIARAFVRRFTLRAFGGAAVGTAIAATAIAFLPAPAQNGNLLPGLGFAGAEWLLPLAIPVLAAMVAFWATRAAAFRMLKTVH